MGWPRRNIISASEIREDDLTQALSFWGPQQQSGPLTDCAFFVQKIIGHFFFSFFLDCSEHNAPENSWFIPAAAALCDM